MSLKVESLTPPGMGAGAKEGSLGDAYIRAKRDGSQAKNENFLPDPDMIPDGQAPGEGDIDAGADDDAVAELGAEKTKQPDPKEGRPGKRVEEEDAFAQNPKSLLEPAGAPVKVRVIIEIQSDLR